MRRLGVLMAVAALVVTACGAAAEKVGEELAENIIETDDGVSKVDIDEDGEKVTVEFESEDGGGSIVVGGGEVPAGLPIPVPNGGEVGTSMEQGSGFMVVLFYPIDEFDDLEEFYSDWVADQVAENLVTNSMTSPRSASWYGETDEGSFAITLVEGADGSGDTAAMVSLSWTVG